jgi:hypothetical protein
VLCGTDAAEFHDGVNERLGCFELHNALLDDHLCFLGISELLIALTALFEVYEKLLFFFEGKLAVYCGTHKNAGFVAVHGNKKFERIDY